MMSKFLRNAGRVAANPAMAAAYARWAISRLCGRTLRVSLPGGGSVGGFSTFSGYWSFRAVTGAEYELLKQVTKHTKVLGDIGANLGAFTIALARLAPHARVHCFEPAPSTRTLLEANIRANQLANITCWPLAICDEDKPVSFTDQTFGSANNSLVRAQCLENAPVVTVPGMTLDHFCASNGIDGFDFLKIDAEGAEPRIIHGAQGLFRNKKVKSALIEISGYWLNAAGSSALELAQQIRSLGYDLYFLADDGTPGNRLSDDSLQTADLMNALLLPS